MLYRFSVGGLKIKQARDVLTKLERKVKLSLSIAKDTFTGGQMLFPVPLGNTGFSDAIPFISLPILPPFFFNLTAFISKPLIFKEEWNLILNTAVPRELRPLQCSFVFN